MNTQTNKELVNYDQIREKALMFDLWLDKAPTDLYELCPCGCGKKIRFAEKEGIEKHIQNLWNKEIKNV